MISKLRLEQLKFYINIAEQKYIRYFQEHLSDRGSLWWKDRVGKVASMTCRCRVAQNATYTCLSLAERKGRTMEKLEVEGPEGCRAVADFL